MCIIIIAGLAAHWLKSLGLAHACRSHGCKLVGGSGNLPACCCLGAFWDCASPACASLAYQRLKLKVYAQISIWSPTSSSATYQQALRRDAREGALELRRQE